MCEFHDNSLHNDSENRGKVFFRGTMHVVLPNSDCNAVLSDVSPTAHICDVLADGSLRHAILASTPDRLCPVDMSKTKVDLLQSLERCTSCAGIYFSFN